jgi:hypothetical protein
MTTDAVLDTANPAFLAGPADDHMRVGQRAALLADATAHLLFAYEAFDEFSQISTKPWSSRTFVRACRCLCARLIAMRSSLNPRGPMSKPHRCGLHEAAMPPASLARPQSTQGEG